MTKTGTADGRPVGAMMDVSFLRLGDMINVRPDLLVVPSALPPFAKVCSACPPYSLASKLELRRNRCVHEKYFTDVCGLLGCGKRVGRQPWISFETKRARDVCEGYCVT